MSQYYNSYPGNYNQGYAQETTPGLKALKNSFGSTIYLIACITFSLTLVLAFVEMFVPAANPLGAILMAVQQYASQMGVDMPSGFNLPALVSGGGIVGGIISMIPSILICLGMWLIYAASKKATVPASTAGFSILQTMNIIAVVGMCFSTLIVVIAGIIGLVGVGRLSSELSSYGYSSVSPTLILAIALLLAIIVLVFAIIYYVKTAAIYSISKDILRYNRSSRRVSMFVIVINFIGLVFTVISLIVSLAGASVLAAYAPVAGASTLVTVISSVASFLASLFQTLTFVKARNEFSALSTQGGSAGYQSYNFETGAYNTGSYNTGSYNTNTFNTGSYNTANYQTQNYQTGNYQQQTYQQPDAYQQQTYQQPDAYQQQTYQQADAYQQQTYQQTYQQADAYQQQTYQQDNYQQQ